MAVFCHSHNQNVGRAILSILDNFCGPSGCDPCQYRTKLYGGGSGVILSTVPKSILEAKRWAVFDHTFMSL